MADPPSIRAGTHALLSDRGNLRRRRRVGTAIEILSVLATLLAVAVLILVVGSVFLRGVSSINLDFLTKGPAPFGESGGGISNAIIGSAMLVGLASLIAIPMGLLIAIFTTEFAENRLASLIRFALDILNGVPTIITGIFILGLIVIPQGKQSGFAGSIALAIIMMPIVARAGQEVLALVPDTLKEAATALGVTRWRIVLRIVLPTAAGGLLTGSLLAVARVAGETAPLLLVSSIVSTETSTNYSQALASIPLSIFQLSESPSPAAHDQAWAAAFILIMFVLLLNIVARAFYARSQRRMRG